MTEHDLNHLGPVPRAVHGLAAGLVTAAAMLGMLIGLGRRAGTAWRPLNAAAHVVVGGMADGVWGYHGIVTPTGGLVVLAVSIAAGLAVTRLAPSLQMKQVAAAAAGIAIGGYLVHAHLAARSAGGVAELLSVGELRALYGVAALALVAGTRFALDRGSIVPEESREPGMERSI